MPERALVRAHRSVLFGMCGDQGAVYPDHHHSWLADPTGEAGLRHSVRQLRPQVRPSGGPGPAHRSPAGVADLPNARSSVVSDATGPNTAACARSASTSTMSRPPHAIATAASTRTRPRSWTGTRPAPNERPRQRSGQTRPVGQHPQRHRAGQRHDTPTIGRDPQITAPCGNVQHVESASLVEILVDVGVPSLSYAAGTFAFPRRSKQAS
jgi:hypothetical protein